ncbi:FAD-binding oxidoreductase [Ancylobacter sp. Lp-2]|uniref:FAD-binding oxidoreductase n=1 Tax=Ancylobacter sp. Lp-2 TaxID=2881339 RepID=UPI001E33652F|nr:FAD-binding oxidoreductase [Ancylobacter sp. Lp-2]MCB4767111.1 FAD-binding oxidoreductase [Ancylobacter sp. Lp-2]
MMLSGWGGYPRIEAVPARPAAVEEVQACIGHATSLIGRGNGRAYGDAALNAVCVLDMRRMNRLVAFDEETGLLVCEAGLLLSELIDLFLPRGWFVPVTPGTRFVTVGGMVAANVHGKNHHVDGSFGDHVDWIDLALADGRLLRCSSIDEADIFNATLGGMGLTGIIFRVAFFMRRIETDLVWQRVEKAADLDVAMDLFEANGAASYSVAWIDCLSTGARLGRSLVMLGEHLGRDELPAGRAGRAFATTWRQKMSLPFSPPALMLNRYSVSAFNAAYYRRGRPGDRLVTLFSYFYPLDTIGNWNRLYGRDGFVQYQFVLPMASSRTGLRAILSRVAAAGVGSFLAVLKLFGAALQRPASLSFPREGYTLALDFPVCADTFNLLLDLDRVVAAHGGRLYLAKDARGGPSILAGYEEVDAFRAVRARLDPLRRFSSLLSQRLDL